MFEFDKHANKNPSSIINLNTVDKNKVEDRDQKRLKLKA